MWNFTNLNLVATAIFALLRRANANTATASPRLRPSSKYKIQYENVAIIPTLLLSCSLLFCKLSLSLSYRLSSMSSPTDFMTPSDLVNQMAFSKQSRRTRTHRPSYEPLAPPPASPPPLPPPSDALQQPLPASFIESDSNNNNNNNNISSYQKQSSIEDIRVTHYYTSGTTTTTAHHYRGDASVRPNTGQVNSPDGGDALNERVWKLQIVNLTTCVVAILLEIPAVLGHFLTLHPARAVLGAYLVIFSALLALYELHTPRISRTLHDNLGILVHPLGRSLYLLLLGGLCLGQGWLPLDVVGIVFWTTALQTLYCYVKFPQYRRVHDSDAADEHYGDEQDLWLAARTRATRYAWARPEQLGLLHATRTNANHNADDGDDAAATAAVDGE